MDALKRYRDYTKSTFTKYDSALAAITDDNWESDQFTMVDQYYSLTHYRRCSVIRMIDSHGFHYAKEYPTEEEAQAYFDKIRDEYYAELDSRANEAHPDRWAVCFVAHCGVSAHAYTCDDESEARTEMARRLRRLRRIGKTLYKLGDLRYESSDPNDAAMVSDDAGFLYIDHVDRSEDRERFLEMAHYA